jgi:hypothetical protein
MAIESIPLISKDSLIAHFKNESLFSELPDLSAMEVQEMLAEAKEHLRKSEDAAKKGLTDAKTAKAIYQKLLEIHTYLKVHSPSSATWEQFKLVIVYFVQENDEENDFDSPVGFDDDAEIVNCFLKTLGNPLPPIPLS